MTAVPANGNYFNQVNPNVYNEWAVGAGLAYHSMMKGFLRYVSNFDDSILKRH